MGKQRGPQVCLRAPSRASEPWRTTSPRASQCPVLGPPQARGTAQLPGFPLGAPAQAEPPCLCLSPRERQLCCPGPRLRSTKAARPPKCECRRLRAGGGRAGAALRVRVPVRPRPRAAPPSHRGCRKEDADVERAARPSLGPERGGALPPLVFLLLCFQALLTSPGPGPPHPAPAVLARPQALQLLGRWSPTAWMRRRGLRG